jgi:hypothetical protein
MPQTPSVRASHPLHPLHLCPQQPRLKAPMLGCAHLPPRLQYTTAPSPASAAPSKQLLPHHRSVHFSAPAGATVLGHTL